MDLGEEKNKSKREKKTGEAEREGSTHMRGCEVPEGQGQPQRADPVPGARVP